MNKVFSLILGILILSICLAGCTSQQATPTPAPTPSLTPVATRMPLATQSSIAGTWDLQSYSNGKEAMQTVIPGSETTAVFGADGKLSGSGGCNQYSAQYTTTVSNAITITPPSSTMMACKNNLMQQETQYLSLLPTAAKYDISGDQLTLFNSTGTKLLIYKSADLKVNPL